MLPKLSSFTIISLDTKPQKTGKKVLADSMAQEPLSVSANAGWLRIMPLTWELLQGEDGVWVPS